MGYVFAGILVLLLVAGFVTFVVLNSMRKGSARADHDGPAGIGPDPTPLGDTTEHAGEQTEHGTTASDPERNAGEDEAARGFDPAAAERTEGDDRKPGPDVQPASERLADRPR